MLPMIDGRGVRQVNDNTWARGIREYHTQLLLFLKLASRSQTNTGLDHMGGAGDVRRARIIIDFWGAPRVRGDTNTDNSDTIAI